MEPGVLRDVLTAGAGVATGALSGMFGVGGAVISTPAIRALGLPASLAVGTTLPAIIPGAASGTARYVRANLIDWRIVGWAGPGGAVAAIAGSLLAPRVPGDGHLLMLMTAALLGLSAWRTATTKPTPPPEETPTRPGGAVVTPARQARPGAVASVGVAAGLLSGLLGVGGGIVMVPGFAHVVGMPLKRAIATSLACVAVFAVPGTVTHALQGTIDWRFAILLAIGVVPGARLGAGLTLRASDQRMRVVVAAFLGITAVIYAGGELRALWS